MLIERLADACGGLVWISEQMMLCQRRLAMAELDKLDAGSLATGVAENAPGALDDGTIALLARSSRRYAQHGGWWRDLLPDSPALNSASRIGPPTQQWADTFNQLSDVSPSQAIITLHTEVLDELRLHIEKLLELASPISEGAFMRVAQMVLADLATEQVARKELRA
ncbi:MAG: hypothetical protein OXE04_09365 [bacterium]|nr:hypothetical protein [bacterium]